MPPASVTKDRNALHLWECEQRQRLPDPRLRPGPCCGIHVVARSPDRATPPTKGLRPRGKRPLVRGVGDLRS